MGACRGSLTAPAPGLPATGQPSGGTLTSKGSEPADWAASSGSLPPPCLAPPDAPRPARSPTSPCQGGTERVGRVATSETETHVVTPMRAHVARPELDGPEAAWESYVDLETRLEAHPADTSRRGKKPPKQFTATVASFLLLIPPPTLRESLGEIRGARGICSAVSGPDKVFWRLLCMPMRTKAKPGTQ